MVALQTEPEPYIRLGVGPAGPVELLKPAKIGVD